MRQVIRVAVAGASGKMGQAVIAELLGAPKQFQLYAAFDQPGSPLIGRDAAERLGMSSGVRVTESSEACKGAEVLIDFTRPEATMAHLQVCTHHGIRPVIGTTGFSDDQLEVIQAFSHHQAVVLAPNMSVGVNIFFRLAELAAGFLHQGYDMEVIEAHHRAKVDAPSGTALKVGERIAKAAGRQWPQHAVWQRHGYTGHALMMKLVFKLFVAAILLATTRSCLRGRASALSSPIGRRRARPMQLERYGQPHLLRTSPQDSLICPMYWACRP